MLESLTVAFQTMRMKRSATEDVVIHSHTSREQGLFLQELFDLINPAKSLEVGLAYGISTLFILEKHRAKNSPPGSHIVIEPFPWGGVAEYNIEQEGLTSYADIRYQKSHEVLPQLFFDQLRIQYAYVDTTKVFDVVMQDFYFIDKLLDPGGVIILDDCGGAWPGIQRVARFINSLPHYKVLKTHNRIERGWRGKLKERAITSLIHRIPMKNEFYPTLSFRSDRELGLDYACIAFQKISEDERNWDFDAAF